MSEFGWIKLHRRITEWHHWSSPNVLATFIHLLTLANYEPKEWNGVVVQRGQLVTTQRTLAKEIGMPHGTLRDVLKRLENTGEIDVQVMRTGNQYNYTLITVLNYDAYQGSDAAKKEVENPHTNPHTNPAHQEDGGKARNNQCFEGFENKAPHTPCTHQPDHEPAHTKEYIKNNIYSTLTTTTTTRERVKGESEILNGSEPQTNRLNTERDFEERKNFAAKKERSDFAKLVETNAEVVGVLSENKQWVEVTAKASRVTEAEVREKLKEFELTNNANNNQLEVSKAYRHFVKWFNLNRDIERRRTRTKPQAKSKLGAVSDFWNSPEAKAIEERNRREGEELMKKYKISEI